MKIDVKLTDNITKATQVQERQLKELYAKAYKQWVETTPIRSGNARRKTSRASNTINANYPYAERLDQGYSKQAPKGMTEPTLEEVRQYVYNKLGVKI